MVLSRLTDRLRSDVSADPTFDPEFYRAYYTDLGRVRGVTLLARHYEQHGRAEGRFPNARAMLDATEAAHGPLPAGFSAREYRDMHPDLHGYPLTDWRSAEHYLRFGRKQKRAWYRFDAEVYRALYFPHGRFTDRELAQHFKDVGKAEGRTASWDDYLERWGQAVGPWLDRIRPDEFELLNGAWSGPVPSRPDAVRVLLDEGIDRLAPLAFDQRFDPDYYRQAYGELGRLDDAAAYRHWLFKGLAKGWAGSEEQRLQGLLLPLRRYPDAFDWRAYAQARRAARPTRWSELEHVIDRPLRRTTLLPVARDGAAAFWRALGERWRGKDDLSALEALRRAQAAGDDSPMIDHHRGDALFRLGRDREAVAAFRSAARDPGAVEVWTFVNGARAALRISAFRAARELLEAGRGFAGEPLWRQAVEELAEASFSARTDRARQLYAVEGGRGRADAHVARIVDETAALWNDLDPLGAPLPASSDGRVVMLANLDLRVCTHYRVEQKQQLFDRLGRPLQVFALHQWREFISALPGATAAIVFRLPAWPSVARAMGAARNLGVPIYYEIDDLIFDAAHYPDTLESYGGLIDVAEYETYLFGVPLFRAALQLADHGIVSTTPLERAVAPLVRSGRVFLLPNGLDDRNEPYLETAPDRMRRDGSVVIAYASGTKAHNSDFNDLAAPALLEILTRRPDVRLLLMGYLSLPPAFDAVRDQVDRFDYVPDSGAVWSMLADADVNLAVLIPTWATDCKSEIKWLEAAALGVPSVVSETAMYRETLEDGVDVLMARDPEEWRDALGRLVDDPALRRRVTAAARAKAQARYSLDANSRRLAALLAPADAARRAPVVTGRAKPRVLLANIWFAPHLIGGATRVVRDNLAGFLDGPAAERFDFAVAATDHAVETPYRVRVDAWRDVPVFRVSPVQQRNMDWLPADARVGEIFADLVDLWRPDLVHFHAPQRLTVASVEACAEAGVPYLCTVHDAWWLSDWHFLVDDRGRVRAPCEPTPHDPPEGVGVAQAVERRRRLRRALDGAQVVVGVSETFAHLYRRCGFERAIAIPNGTSLLPETPRRPSSTGRVRLGHVGNVSRHKGFHLVEAALRRGRFANLELTAVDFARPPGSVEHTTWGETPVRIIGKVPQGRVHELYAELDVLLAPSIWPESFGLVTREALAQGLWVLASDRGAIGEDVRPGVNGFVVDVSGVEGLLGALSAIDADPQTYLRSPAVRPALRTADDQARELLALYDDILGRPKPAPWPGKVEPEPVKRPRLRADARG